MFSFLHIGVTDILDIILVGLLIFSVIRMFRNSQARSIFVTIILLYAARIVCGAFNMKMTSSILATILDVGLLAVIVIFQPEVRRFLASVGNAHRKAGLRGWFSKMFGSKEKQESAETINEICKACEEMSRDKCGVLIVLKKRDSLSYIVDTGDVIDAVVSKRLLMNLFFKNSPLHDGAVVIDGDRVVAARCTLPITEQNVPASFGMRHKAAVGISEVTDAQVVVVSEETGGISVMQGGAATAVSNINDLKLLLQNG